MRTGNRKAPVRGQTHPGRDCRFENSASNPNLNRKTNRRKAGTPYTITPCEGEAFHIAVTGRDRWALEELRKAVTKGCTPIENPAPRWSAYVFNLRELGVEIETVTEPHDGNFPGYHAV